MSELKFKFKMPDDESLAEYISVKGEKGDKGDPTKLSELENDTGFVTADTDALTNYYTKAQADSAIDADVAALKTELGVPDGFFADASETISSQISSAITLEGTAKAVLKEIKLYGDTRQESTPTPDSPIVVEVVTGDQAVIISNNEQQSESYTISLGDVELCKIGNHQDYIYQSGNKWYKHKAIEKVVLDGSSDEGWITSGITYRPNSVYFANLADATTTQALSNLFTVWDNTGGGITTRLPNHSFGWATSGNKLMAVRYDASESLEDFKDLLNGAPMVVYYELDSASEEEITDAALVDQLEAVKSARSYNETTVISVTGSLAALLSVEAFKNNWAGTTSGINSEIDDTYTKAQTDELLGTKADASRLDPYNYPYPELSLNRVYRELIAKNYDGLTTYDDTQSGASGVQGGVATGDSTMLFTYWNGDNIDLNENRIVEKDIISGSTLKETSGNYGWCNGLAYNPDKELVYVIPRGRTDDGVSTWLKDIIVLNYSDLSYVDTVTLDVDKTIQSAYYADGELWVMAEGAKKFYEIDVDNYTVIKTVETQIPDSNSEFYYQNFAYYDKKFWLLGSLPRALMVYNNDGSLFRQYTMPTSANGLHNVGEYQFIGHLNANKFYIGSSQGVGTDSMNQIFMMDLEKGYVEDLRYNGEPTSVDTRLSLYVDASNLDTNPDGTESNPFREVYEAVMIPNRNRPVRIYVADGEYNHVNIRGARNYSIVGVGETPDFTISGFHFRECTDFVMFNAKIKDSAIAEEEASLYIRNSTVSLRSVSISSAAKYAAYLSEGTILNIGREVSMTSPAMPNVYVDATSQLRSDIYSGITLRKSAATSKISAPMALFATEQTHYLGDLALDAILAEWLNRAYFGFVSIDYTCRGTRKVVKFPASLQQPCITESYIDGSGNTFINKCYVNIGASKITMSNNNYVKIANNSGEAAITKSSLDSNEHGDSSYIAVKNIYFSDN